MQKWPSCLSVDRTLGARIFGERIHFAIEDSRCGHVASQDFETIIAMWQAARLGLHQKPREGLA